MKNIIIILLLGLMSCQQSEDFQINGITFIQVDTLNTNCLLGFTDSVLLKNNKIVFYKNPYVINKKNTSKLVFEEDNNYFFNKSSLLLSHNKRWFTITGYQISSISNTISDTLCFLGDTEKSKVTWTKHGSCDGRWRGNNWTYIDDKAYFHSKDYEKSLTRMIQEIDTPLLFSNMNFTKIETLQKNKIIVGYSDSTILHLIDSDAHLNLYYQPYIIKGKECFKIKNYPKEWAGDLLSISPNGRFLLMGGLDIGYIDIEENAPPFLHDKYYCVIIDITRNEVIAQMESACGGEWDKDSNWIYSTTFFKKPDE